MVVLPDRRKIDLVVSVRRVVAIHDEYCHGTSPCASSGWHRSPNGYQGAVVENVGTTDLCKKLLIKPFPPFSITGVLDKVILASAQLLSPIYEVALRQPPAYA